MSLQHIGGVKNSFSPSARTGGREGQCKRTMTLLDSRSFVWHAHLFIFTKLLILFCAKRHVCTSHQDQRSFWYSLPLVLHWKEEAWTGHDPSCFAKASQVWGKPSGPPWWTLIRRTWIFFNLVSAGAKVHWFPFQLNPNAPVEGQSKIELYNQKFGQQRVAQMIPMMTVRPLISALTNESVWFGIDSSYHALH